jgi:seryl-tRNA synthetase
MSAYVTREEFKVLQDEVEGEKLVTRHILEQTRLNSKDIATLIREVKGIKSDVGGLKSDVRSLKSDVRDLQTKVGTLDAKLTGLIHNLPAMIAEAVREGLRGRRKKD